MPVDLSGLHMLEADLAQVRRDYPKAAKKGLSALGELMVSHIRERVEGDGVDPPKEAHDGKPTLVDSGVYLASLTPSATTTQLDIDAVGDNDRMSNAELAEALENGPPARPHLRPEGLWAEEHGAEVVGEHVGSVFRKVGG